MIFSDPPTIELLRWLARDSLKRNLPRAIRLWAWLRCLYSDIEANQTNPFSLVSLPDSFTYANWRDAFFSSTHPTNEAIPALHDENCRCRWTIADWLTAPDSGINISQWSQTLQQHNAMPTHMDELLQQRLFGVTRRSLSEDLQTLYELGWLKKTGQKYGRVRQFPSRITEQADLDEVVKPLDLAMIVRNLSQRINGQQRFFLHVDYVVPIDALDRVDDWVDLLKQLWEQFPVPPIQITYQSVKLGAVCQAIVYPVCIYYVQRAVYLCAWGEVADDDSPALIQRNLLDWRNYRLDRIQSIQVLSWTDAQVPVSMCQAAAQQCLPNPDNVQMQMSEVWGFDFYQPRQTMVLRFDRWFDEAYVRGTIRHDRFEPIEYDEIKQLIEQQTPDVLQRQELLQIWTARSGDDAYYVAHYRKGDPNVMQRLRAWRPKVEVLLSWELRQQVAEEVLREAKLYQSQEP